MIKKIYKLALVILITGFLLNNNQVIAVAAFNSTISGTTNITINSEFTLTFGVSGAENLVAIFAKINYSPTYLEIVSFSGLNNFDVAVDTNIVADLKSGSPKNGTFTYVTIKFKAKTAFKAGTTTQISLSNVSGTKDSSGNVFDVDGNGATVTIKATAPKSTNNNLASLSVNGTSVAGFSSSDTSYTLANTDAESITIAATAQDSKATVSGTGKKTLAFGVNTFNIVVTAESGAKKTYTVTVTKNDYRSTNNDLKSLTIEGYQLMFDKERLTYTLIVDNIVTSINVSALAADEKASVTGTGTKTLKIYSNLINVVVTAENTAKKTYTINVVRRDAAGIAGDLSRDNKLKSLTVTDYPFEFNPDTLEYTIDVENWIESIEIVAELNDPKASYVLSNQNELIIGPNEVLIKVYSESAEERVYKLIVNRQGDNPVVAIDRIIGLLPRIIAENIEITTKDPKSMSAEIWNQLVNTNKKYMFSVRNDLNETLYMWTFTGTQIKTNELVEFDVRFDSEQYDEIRKLLNYRESVLLNLAHSGAIPEGLILRVNVSSQYKDGSILYLYYYNEESGKLEDKSKEFIVNEGFVELDLVHASQYVLTPVKISIFNDFGMVLLGVFALLSALMILVFIMMSLKIRALKRRISRKNEIAA